MWSNVRITYLIAILSWIAVTFATSTVTTVVAENGCVVVRPVVKGSHYAWATFTCSQT